MYRCDGEFGGDDRQVESYYSRIYKSGKLYRVFPHEHTGLLRREDREDIEQAFRTQEKPNGPNMLVATPTLEMGIDIGDLSALVLCAVPPSTANFIQRVGRAGRKTGNALCMTLVNARPHDLYFHEMRRDDGRIRGAARLLPRYARDAQAPDGGSRHGRLVSRG
jgi:DEAD/DEAH box helicase domain-containing protein